MSNQLATIPDNEFERLLKLSEYDIDYTEIHGKLDDLTKLAAYVTGTPISLVNIMEANTQWTLSNYGLDVTQTPRKDTACQYVILDDKPMEVEDMKTDERFSDKNYVTNSPNIRYYYGVPLTSPDGLRIGAMCVMDTKKNDLSPEKEEFLSIIANEVVTRIEYEHKLKLMRHNVDELKEIQRKVSHDIRGPIGGIIGIAEILRDQAEESKMEEFMQLLELINKGGRSVLDLADEILSNYKDTAQKPKFPEHQLNLSALKEKLIGLYNPQAKTKSITYSVSIITGQDEYTFPKYRLLQIFGNLITNAIKFTPVNGTVHVDLSLSKVSEPKLQFVVEDTGVGMEPEKINQILSDQAQTTAGTKYERGFGFGFQLARHLVESMEGSIEIDSEPGKGTKVSVNIPL
jgi:signal transduction histidine kinase